jgi:hypothetical protein
MIAHLTLGSGRNHWHCYLQADAFISIPINMLVLEQHLYTVAPDLHKFPFSPKNGY